MKFYLQSHRGGRSEPAGLHRLRKQLTEAREGHLEFRSRKAKVRALRGKVSGKCGCALWRESLPE